MQSSTSEILPIIGTSLAGGFYAGRIRQDDGTVHALVVSPKVDGQHDDTIWIPDYQAVPSAHSFNDGFANTLAMADAGSELARWARAQTIGGFDDWYLPSQDELEILYRNLKPTTSENHVWNRSGTNLSAVEPTRPYLLNNPAQTIAEAFQKGGKQTFDSVWYWSSTQHASASDCAWCQDFYDGFQGYDNTGYKLRARLVRRFVI